MNDREKHAFLTRARAADDRATAAYREAMKLPPGAERVAAIALVLRTLSRELLEASTEAVVRSLVCEAVTNVLSLEGDESMSDKTRQQMAELKELIQKSSEELGGA